jgi:hypothetical protein
VPNTKPLSFWFMFVRPVVTLASLGERSRWLCPVLVSAAISVAANFYVIYRIGLVRLINAAAKSNAILDPQAAVQNALAHPHQIHVIQALSTFIGSLLTTLVVAKVIWLILTLLGQDIRFKKVLSLTAYVTALSVIIRGCMLALTTTLIRDLNTLDLRNPLATNPAFFLQPLSPMAFRILSSLDVITFMNIALLTIGLTKMCTRLSLRTASMVVVIPWVIYIGTSLLLPTLLS